MTGGFIPFALPDIGDEEIDEVVDTLRSGWLTTGPKAAQFEAEFSRFIGDGVISVAVSSATAGLHLALEAIGIGEGDEVITTTHTFTATAEVVRYLGATPVFVDIDPDSFCIDVAAIEAAITDRTRAVLPVHFGGFPCDMERLIRLAAKYGLRVVEDAAHAFTARYSGTLIGALDTACTVFSFYATKTLATGEGGMLVTRDPELASRAQTMRLHGIDRDAFERYTSNKPSWFYDVIAPGYKYNMTDIAAAMGLHQLKAAPRFLERRNQLTSRYNEGLSPLPLTLPTAPIAPSVHAWHLYVVQLTEDAAIERDEVIERMHRKGVGCSVHYRPLHLHTYWREQYGLEPRQFPNSQRLYGRSLSLPLYTRMTDADQIRVIGALHEVLKS